jgi:hypothetical protein
MSRRSCNPVRAKAALGALLLGLVTGALACEEDGKTAPARCADPALPIFDIQAAGVPSDDNAQYPCVTPVGHAINSSDTDPTAGTNTGGAAGATSEGEATTAGAAGAGGAGGAP